MNEGWAFSASRDILLHWKDVSIFDLGLRKDATLGFSAPTDSPYNVAVNVLNSTAIHVSFSPPQQQMVPGVNLGYKVRSGSLRGGDWIGSRTRDDSAANFVP